MSKLTMKEAAQIAGIHIKTLERWVKEIPEFREAVGYKKHELNGRVTFDESWFRSYVANMSGDDSIRSIEPGVIDGEIVPAGAIEKVEPVGVLQTIPERSGSDPIGDLRSALLLNHKYLLTPKEAAQISGLSQKAVRAESRKVNGKWKITPEHLRKLCDDLFALGVSIEPDVISPKPGRKKGGINK